MLAFLPVWFLIMAMVWEKIKLDKKAKQDYEQWRNEFWKQALRSKNEQTN